MMPNLLNFFEEQRDVPIQQPYAADRAHRRRPADDRDRPVRRPAWHADRQSYQAYNADGTTDPAGILRVLDRSGLQHRGAPEPWPRHEPVHGLLARPAGHGPARPGPGHRHPGPVGALHQAGCNVGEVATADRNSRTPRWTSPRCSARTRRRRSSSPRTRTPSRIPRPLTMSASACTAPRAAHSARTPAESSSARPPRRATASRDLLPQEPGGYARLQGAVRPAIRGPQLGAGKPDLSQERLQVTNAAGNLVDLDGNQLNGAFLTNHPGFPASAASTRPQTLAYMADMLESGVPVVNGYISDIHGNELHPRPVQLRARARRARQRQRVLHRGRPGTTTGPSAPSQAARRRRDHREEHAVRAQLGQGRSRGRRERRAGQSAHAGQLRWRDRQRHHGDPGQRYAPTRPGHSASWTPT